MTHRTKLGTGIVVIAIFGALAVLWITAAMVKHQPVKLQMRTFKVDPVAFYQGLNLPANSQKSDSDVTLAAKNFFKKAGIDLTEPRRSIAYNGQHQLLLVKATAKELDGVEHAIVGLNLVPQQLHIKARFIEVPPDAFDSIWKAGTVVSSTETNTVEVISPDKFRPLLRQLRTANAETLAEPEVVTLSGRQTQMRAPDIQEILLADNSNNFAAVPKSKQFEIGPTIDIVPNLLADGFTVDLTVIPELLEFLGYEQKTNGVSPHFRVQETTVHVKLWDGQTVALGNLKGRSIDFTNGVERVMELKSSADANSTTNRQLVVFITANVVDPAGNRVHSDEDLKMAERKAVVPPQR